MILWGIIASFVPRLALFLDGPARMIEHSDLFKASMGGVLLLV